jgi:hypothetical protein
MKAGVADQVSAPEPARLIPKAPEPFEANSPHPNRGPLTKTRDGIDCPAHPLDGAYTQIAKIDRRSIAPVLESPKRRLRNSGAATDDSFSHVPTHFGIVLKTNRRTIETSNA